MVDKNEIASNAAESTNALNPLLGGINRQELLGAVGLDDLFGDLDASEGKAPGARRKPKGAQKPKTQSPKREPAIDLFEEDDAVLIYVELPGADEDSIKLSRHNGSLVVEAQADRDTFSREIDLPKGDWSSPKHQFKNGILKIELKQKKKSSGKK